MRGFAGSSYHLRVGPFWVSLPVWVCQGGACRSEAGGRCYLGYSSLLYTVRCSRWSPHVVPPVEVRSLRLRAEGSLLGASLDYDKILFAASLKPRTTCGVF